MKIPLESIVKRIGPYELIAFITGFVLMAFELVASRILAPTVGTSTYVWTNIIGVIIAALAIGYAVGGYIADRRNQKSDIAWLLLITACSIVLVGLLYEPVLADVSRLVGDPRAQGFFASLYLFAIPSFLLGTLSPYLARLRLHSLETTGRSVAGLSAANSLGGITGTFCTGFIFFSVIGSLETLALIAAVLLVCSWFILPRYQFRQRIAVSGIAGITILLLFTTPVGADVVAEIDTPSAHYKIVNVTINERPVRVLTMGPAGWQSGSYQDGSKELVFGYTSKIADTVATVPNKGRILILGGGAFSLPEYLGNKYPASIIDVVEIDPKLPAIAKKYFNYVQPPNVHVFSEDARTYLQKTNSDYDVIVVDVYNDASVPFALTTEEYTTSLKAVLQPNGVVIANLIAAANQQCMPLLASVHASYAKAFSNSLYFPLYEPTMTTEQNVIAVHSNNSLAWTTSLPGGTFVQMHSATRLTDNFAPVEQLKQKCSTS
jgi:predicted membrane-bound spermidine synthase